MKYTILFLLFLIANPIFSSEEYKNDFINALKSGNEKLAIDLLKKNKVDKEEYLTVYFNKATLKLAFDREKNQKYYTYFISPLHISAYFNYEKLLNYLLDSGVYVDSKDKDNDTPLHIAAMEGHINIIQVLLSNNAFIDSKGNNGLTPLHRAVMNRKFEVVQFLVNSGAKLNIRNKSKQTPYDMAIAYRYYKIAQFLKKSEDIDKNKTFKSGKVKSKDKMAAFLEKKKIEISKQLHQAVISNNLRVAEKLLINGINPNAIDNYGETPLFYANNYQLGKLLTLYGADVNFKSKFGLSPLHRASFLGYTKIVNLLLYKGADINMTDKYGQSALHYPKNTETAKLLIKHGAKINLQDKAGNTPLHYAVLWKKPKLVKTLLDFNANPNLKNNEKQSPYELAMKQKNTIILKLFKKQHHKNSLHKLLTIEYR